MVEARVTKGIMAGFDDVERYLHVHCLGREFVVSKESGLTLAQIFTVGETISIIFGMFPEDVKV